MNDKLLQVGDTLITNNMLGDKKYPITRVTKTLAMSARSNGKEHSFKREISFNMAHPYERWNTTEYRVERFNIQNLIKKLHNSKYPFRLTKQVIQYLGSLNLILVYGQSDDMISVSGAINDDEYISGNMSILLSKKGILKDNESLDTDNELLAWKEQKDNSKEIKILWDSNGYLWEYETEIPHDEFDILDGEDKYCKAMIISMDKLL